MIEANRNRIIVTAPTLAEVQEDINGLLRCVGETYVRFTDPVKQADSQYVSTGRVVL